MSITRDEVAARFASYPVDIDQAGRMEAIRRSAQLLADYIVDNSKESREQSLAITALEEAVKWANTGIARYGTR